MQVFTPDQREFYDLDGYYGLAEVSQSYPDDAFLACNAAAYDLNYHPLHCIARRNQSIMVVEKVSRILTGIPSKKLSRLECCAGGGSAFLGRGKGESAVVEKGLCLNGGEPDFFWPAFIAVEKTTVLLCSTRLLICPHDSCCMRLCTCCCLLHGHTFGLPLPPILVTGCTVYGAAIM